MANASEVIGRGATLVLPRERGAAATLLGRLTPDAALTVSLDDIRESDDYIDLDPPPPIEADLTVDGEEWGWLWQGADDGNFRWSENWRPVPMRFRDDACELLAVFWNTGSMASTSFTGYVRQLELVTEFELWDDDSLTKRRIDYGVNADDAAEELASLSFAEPPCADDDFWEVSVRAHASLSERGRRLALNNLWQPCDDPNASITAFGATWVWQRDSWHPAGR